MTIENSSDGDKDRFEVVKLLGKGACGRVLQVKDKKRGGKDLALKILECSYALDKHARERFIKEILILCSIEHKNLVTAYDLVKYEGKDAYTMELVEGDTLAAHIGKFATKAMTNREIDSIMRQLLLAVGELHRRNIVHRDIKLENVMLREDNLVKLNDLGLIKVVGENPKTDPGVLLGTAYYMPPEYILSQGVDQRADIYACGIVLWELLSGKRRFTETNGEKVLREIIQSKFQHPDPNLSGDRKKYARILKKALAVDRNTRFQNADQMIKAFDGVFPKEPGHQLSRLSKMIITLIILAMAVLFYMFLK